ncbi:LamG-like jellyroll fold domain-containing protein [Patescibacteria group bacterium]
MQNKLSDPPDPMDELDQLDVEHVQAQQTQQTSKKQTEPSRLRAFFSNKKNLVALVVSGALILGAVLFIIFGTDITTNLLNLEKVVGEEATIIDQGDCAEEEPCTLRDGEYENTHYSEEEGGIRLDRTATQGTFASKIHYAGSPAEWESVVHDPAEIPDAEVISLKSPLVKMRFEEPDGKSVFRDDSGNFLNGRCLGNVCPRLRETGRNGTRGRYFQRGQYVNFGEFPERVPTGVAGDELSIAAWVNFDAISQDQFLFTYQGLWWVRIRNNGEVWFNTRNGSNKGTTRTIPYDPDEEDNWHHIAATWKAGAGTHIYVDGEEWDQVKPNNQTVNDPEELNTDVGDGQLSFGNNLKGIVDDAYLFRQVLSLSEIQQIKDESSLAQQEVGNEVMLLQFQEPENTTAFADTYPSLNNGKCWGDGCPETTDDGAAGRARIFDGSDILTFGPVDIPTGQLGDGLSIVAWVKIAEADQNYAIARIYNKWSFEIRDAHVFFNTYGATVTSHDQIPLNEWVAVGVAWKVGEEVTLHIGRPRSAVLETTNTSPDDPQKVRKFYVGAGFTGGLDNLYIYDEALSGDDYNGIRNQLENPYPILTSREAETKQVSKVATSITYQYRSCDDFECAGEEDNWKDNLADVSQNKYFQYRLNFTGGDGNSKLFQKARIDLVGIDCEYDADGDGLGYCDDCASADPNVNSFMPEYCGDGIDNNCDTATDPAETCWSQEEIREPRDTRLEEGSFENVDYYDFNNTQYVSPDLNFVGEPFVYESPIYGPYGSGVVWDKMNWTWVKSNVPYPSAPNKVYMRGCYDYVCSSEEWRLCETKPCYLAANANQKENGRYFQFKIEFIPNEGGQYFNAGEFDIDYGAPTNVTDADEDGYYTEPFADVPADCDDNQFEVNPGVSEICWNDVDDNCNGENNTPLECGVPEELPPCVNEDGDDFGVDCVGEKLDCNDSNATIYPGAPEVCDDGIDNDCNYLVDETCPTYTSQEDDSVWKEDGADTVRNKFGSIEFLEEIDTELLQNNLTCFSITPIAVHLRETGAGSEICQNFNVPAKVTIYHVDYAAEDLQVLSDSDSDGVYESTCEACEIIGLDETAETFQFTIPSFSSHKVDLSPSPDSPCTMVWPASGRHISSCEGCRYIRKREVGNCPVYQGEQLYPHSGVDIAATGPIKAMFDGKLEIRNDPYCSATLTRTLDDGTVQKVTYMHAQQYFSPGNPDGIVKKGKTIGMIGSGGPKNGVCTQGVYGTHLHVELREGSSSGKMVLKNLLLDCKYLRYQLDGVTFKDTRDNISCWQVKPLAVSAQATARKCSQDYDTDGDGIYKDCDNCPDEWNPDQKDLDGDGAGDICEEEKPLCVAPMPTGACINDYCAGQAHYSSIKCDDHAPKNAGKYVLENCTTNPNVRMNKPDGTAKGAIVKICMEHQRWDYPSCNKKATGDYRLKEELIGAGAVGLGVPSDDPPDCPEGQEPRIWYGGFEGPCGDELARWTCGLPLL